MRIFKTKWFARYVRQERISDHGLRDAIERAERGLVDADLGGGVIKQRVARAGQGRSGGYRMLILKTAVDGLYPVVGSNLRPAAGFKTGNIFL